ncbi:MAG: hypothetical protein AAF799_34585 [Myxococcota bacterium]
MFHFTANLKPYTFSERPTSERFDAYLLSADYASAHRELAAQVRGEGRTLVADNGNVDLMREFMTRFRQEARPLTEARRAHEETLGHYARPGELPRALRAAFSDLAMKVAAASQVTVTEAHARHALERQAAMVPDFLIGMEDLTLATLTSLSIEPEY